MKAPKSSQRAWHCPSAYLSCLPTGSGGRAQPWSRRGRPVSPTSQPSLQIIRKALSEEKRVSTKTSAADLVTETDHVVEALILQELQTRFPSHR